MNIVFIDDNEALLRSAALLIRSAGHDVKTFADPQQAKESLATTPVDLLILDYVFPGMTGDDLLESVRNRLPAHCRIVLISGHTDLIDGRLLEKMGVDLFLPKPLDFNRLRDALGAANPEVSQRSVQ